MMEAGKSLRWIRIGYVLWPRYVLEMSWGTPGGYEMFWRGRVDWCQPTLFRKAAHLGWAIERRLALAGLQWVAMASETPRGLYGLATLRVLVRRATERRSYPD